MRKIGLHNHQYIQTGTRRIGFQHMMADVFECSLCGHIDTRPHWTIHTASMRMMPAMRVMISQNFNHGNRLLELLEKKETP